MVPLASRCPKLWLSLEFDFSQHLLPEVLHTMPRMRATHQLQGMITLQAERQPCSLSSRAGDGWMEALQVLGPPNRLCPGRRDWLWWFCVLGYMVIFAQQLIVLCVQEST